MHGVPNGNSAGLQPQYGGFWRRVGASLIDTLLLLPLLALLTLLFAGAPGAPAGVTAQELELLQGVLTCVASWGAKGHEALIAELKTRYKEPWMTQNAISTYGDMWLIKDALEKAGKADRVAVADALRAMDGGPSKYYPLGELKFDEKGRRVGAGMTIVQWQAGIPVTVFPPQLALSQPFWPKS